VAQAETNDWMQAKKNLGLPADAPYSPELAQEAQRVKTARVGTAPKKMTPPPAGKSARPSARPTFEAWSRHVKNILGTKGKVMASPEALERIRTIDWQAMYNQGLEPAHAANRAIKIARDPNYKAPQPEEDVSFPF